MWSPDLAIPGLRTLSVNDRELGTAYRMRGNPHHARHLTRFTLHEPLWIAWCDSIRVLIRVLAWAHRTTTDGIPGSKMGAHPMPVPPVYEPRAR